MARDKIAVLFTPSTSGCVSYQTRTKIGRRRPFIVIGAPAGNGLHFHAIGGSPRLLFSFLDEDDQVEFYGGGAAEEPGYRQPTSVT